ncbi:MAG: hypothetical protein AAF337_13810 [Pseudomonadota bacterium]
MVCVPASVPQELCEIDDELKAIYHSADTFCVWVFQSVDDRNRFVEETAGMKKREREDHYTAHFSPAP